jgi:hypothetical protein
MDDDKRLERMVKESLQLAKENNRRIRGIQRGMFLSGIVKLLIWGAILGLPIFIYFSLLKPYVDGASNTFESIKTGDPSFLQQFIKIPALDTLQNSFQEKSVE